MFAQYGSVFHVVNSSDPGDLVCSEVILLLCVKTNKVN